MQEKNEIKDKLKQYKDILELMQKTAKTDMDKQAVKFSEDFYNLTKTFIDTIDKIKESNKSETKEDNNDYKTMEELKKFHTPNFNIEDHKFEVDDKINSLNFTININEIDTTNLDVNECLETKSVADKIIYDGRTYELVQHEDDYYYYEHKDVKESLQNFLKEFEHADKTLYNMIKDKLTKHCGASLVD